MYVRGKLASAATIVVAGGLLAGGSASASTINGVVVHHNLRGHSFVVADSRGHLSAVHAKRSPAVGRHVVVRARRLHNGTFVAQRTTTGRHARRTRIRGRVTYINRRNRTFVVSARGASLLVHRALSRHGRVAAAADALPAPGSTVTADAVLAPGGAISAVHTQTDTVAGGPVELEGVVKAVDANAHTLTISADDSEQSGALITVTLPSTFNPSAYTVGGEVELVATLNPDGTYTAVGSSGDSSDSEADSASDDQGEIGSDDQDDSSSDHHGDSSSDHHGDSSSDHHGDSSD